MFAILLNPQVDFNTDWRSLEVGAFIDYLHACRRRNPAWTGCSIPASTKPPTAR